jgi:UDP-glucose:(heptosyl)LPS alpha-1,3-glucosyltransferase
MPGLDVYYAADVCYAEKVGAGKGFFYRLTSRYRIMRPLSARRSSTGKNAATDADRQANCRFQNIIRPSPRFHILPPGIYPDRKYSQQIPMPVRFIARRMV